MNNGGVDGRRRALMRQMLLREAEASVRLDSPESGVHTCHEDCPCQSEGRGES